MSRQDEMHPAEAVDTRLTYDDYLHLPPDGKRHEIIDGEHYVTPAPSRRHQRISRRLVTALDNYLRDHPLGEVLNAPLDVILSDFDVVQPDVVFVSHERDDIADDAVRVAPDIAIEILSASTRRTDEVAKRKLFERVGVREYWIVDPELDLVKIYRREGGKFVRVGECSREQGEAVETPLLPGVQITLEELFR